VTDLEDFPPNLRVLIVDDERDTVATLCEILTDEGYDAVGATSGAEAMREIGKRPPAAVLVDISMPGLSGYDVGREVQRLYGERAPMMVAISGRWTGQTDRMLSELAGFSHFFEKPCRLAALLAVLEPLRNQPPPSPPPFIEPTIERLD
jgi:DNA-binding response OmpR family regulator